MANGYFHSEIDLNSRNECINYLNKHFRYYTLNSWNRSTSYANKIKLYDLPIPSDLKDIAYELVCGNVENPDWETACHLAFKEFEARHGYSIGTNGRSGGYLVLYYMEHGNVYPGRGVDMDPDFDDWELPRLQARVRLVQDFDILCDNLLDTFLNICRNYEIKTVTRQITVASRVVAPKADTDSVI